MNKVENKKKRKRDTKEETYLDEGAQIKSNQAGWRVFSSGWCRRYSVSLYGLARFF